MIEDETSVLREVLFGPPENFEWLPTSAISKAALASGVQLTRRDVLAAHEEMVAAYVDAGVTTHPCRRTLSCPTRCSAATRRCGGPPARS